MSATKHRSARLVRAVSEALEDRRLLSVTIPSNYNLVETMTVNSTSSAFKSFTTDLADGAAYYVVASGTPRIGYTPSNATRRTDAKFHDAQSDSGVYGEPPVAGRNAGRFNFSGVTDPDADGNFDWGPYQSDHIYGVHVLGMSNPFKVQFADSNHADNNGSMTVKLYEKIELHALSVTDAERSNNTVTVATSVPADLYVPLGESGYANVNLAAAFTPETDSERILWVVEEASATPAAGDFVDAPSVTLAPSSGNYEFAFWAGVDTDSNGVLTSTERTRTVNVHLYSAELQFNDTAEENDDLVRLNSAASGSEIPASQPVLDVAVRLVGSPPENLAVWLESADGRAQFAAAAPSSSPVSQPSSPTSTTTTTTEFVASPSWVHLPLVGVTKSVAAGDAIVRVVTNIGGVAAVIADKGATVFWYTNAKMDHDQGEAYSLQGSMYMATDDYAIGMRAQATVEPANLDPNAPQLANLRIGIVQNVESESMGDIYSNPQMTWNDTYSDGSAIPAGTRVTVPDTVFAGNNLVQGTTFPILDAESGLPSPAPLFTSDMTPTEASGFDGPTLPVPARLQPGFPAFPPTTLVFDNANRVVGTVKYTDHIKAIRKVTFTTWCVLVDTAGNQRKVIALLAQNDWQVDLDSTAANQKATHGNSHVPTSIPKLSGPLANSIGRSTNTPVARGGAPMEFVK